MALKPRQVAVIRYFYFIDWHEIAVAIVLHWHCKPSNAVWRFYSVPILEVVSLKLKVVRDHKDVGLKHLVKEAQPRQIIRLMCTHDHLVTEALTLMQSNGLAMQIYDCWYDCVCFVNKPT
jgi:hypothetical protein